MAQMKTGRRQNHALRVALLVQLSLCCLWTTLWTWTVPGKGSAGGLLGTVIAVPQPQQLWPWGGDSGDSGGDWWSMAMLWLSGPWLQLRWMDWENVALFALMQPFWYRLFARSRLRQSADRWLMRAWRCLMDLTMMCCGRSAYRDRSSHGVWPGLASPARHHPRLLATIDWLLILWLVMGIQLMIRWWMAAVFFRWIAWSVPALFSHWAAYERAAGMGVYLLPWLLWDWAYSDLDRASYRRQLQQQQQQEWRKNTDCRLEAGSSCSELDQDDEEIDGAVGGHALSSSSLYDAYAPANDNEIRRRRRRRWLSVIALVVYAWINILFPTRPEPPTVQEESHGGWNLLSGLLVGWLLIFWTWWSRRQEHMGQQQMEEQRSYHQTGGSLRRASSSPLALPFSTTTSTPRLSAWRSYPFINSAHSFPSLYRFNHVRPLLATLLLGVLWLLVDLSRTRMLNDPNGLVPLQNLHMETPTLLTLVVITAPRPGNTPLLLNTLGAWLRALPQVPTEPLYQRVRIEVVSFHHERNGSTSHEKSRHPVFEQAQRLYGHRTDIRFHRFRDPMRELTAQQGINVSALTGDQRVRWMRQRQDMHYSHTLEHAMQHWTSHYVSVIEDDFPVCPGDGWPRLLALLAHAQHPPLDEHCAIFAGTGGSGLIMKSQHVGLIARLLRANLHASHSLPTDIVMQRCLLGLEYPECAPCRNRMIVPSKLLMYHIGYNASTFSDRRYGSRDFQCDWKHPLSGRLDVHSIDI